MLLQNKPNASTQLHAMLQAFPDLLIERLDASDLASMRAVVEGEQIDVVFNLAVIPLPTSLKYPAWTFHTNVGIASTLVALPPVILLPIGYFVFKERFGWGAVVGTLIAIAGVALIFLV